MGVTAAQTSGSSVEPPGNDASSSRFLFSLELTSGGMHGPGSDALIVHGPASRGGAAAWFQLGVFRRAAGQGRRDPSTHSRPSRATSMVGRVDLPLADGHIQAIGTDFAGRRQYRYHD